MKMRLLVLAGIALGLAPGTWLRSETTKRDYDAPLVIAEIASDKAVGELRLTGLWHLTSANDHLGGYSALVALPDGNLLAGSDRGRLLRLPLSGGRPDAQAAQFDFAPGSGENKRRLVDLEALTLDPASETLWAAYESRNAIDRIDPDGTVTRRRPIEIRRLPSNSGPETLLRLADGRFLLLGEGPERRGLPDRPGFVFDRDPADPAAETFPFRFVAPSGYSPVDATLLPDGDVLILLRKVEYRLPPVFNVALMRADPEAIQPGQEWTGDWLAYLNLPELAENFEGLAFIADDSAQAESGSLYLIADDNLSAFQRTLLAQLAWPPMPPAADQANEKAPESPRTP